MVERTHRASSTREVFQTKLVKRWFLRPHDQLGTLSYQKSADCPQHEMKSAGSKILSALNLSQDLSFKEIRPPIVNTQSIV